MRTSLLLVLLCPSLLAQPVESYILIEQSLGLTAAYFLDDIQPHQEILDSSPHARHGIGQGDVTAVGGLIYESPGTAIEITQPGSALVCTDQPLNALDPYTIVMWVQLTPPLIGEQRGLFRKGNNLGADVYFNAPAGKYFIEVVHETAAHGEAADSVVDNNYHMIAFTYDGLFSSIYLDGALLGTQQVQLFGWGGVSTPWLLGQAGNTPAGIYPLDGIMDTFAVWTRELSANELQHMYVLSLQGERFIRGDANANGVVNIADLSAILAASPCADASDANADGAVNVADISYLASYLFSSGPAPSAPFPACGFGAAYGLRCSATSTLCQ